jgi:hypothetical protein
MLLRARQDAAASVPDAAHIRALSAPSHRRAARLRHVLWAGPLAIAAGLGAIYLLPVRTAESAADREFDRLVTEWTRTAAATSHVPTDGLLSVPGAELLDHATARGVGGGVEWGRCRARTSMTRRSWYAALTVLLVSARCPGTQLPRSTIPLRGRSNPS